MSDTDGQNPEDVKPAHPRPRPSAEPTVSAGPTASAEPPAETAPEQPKVPESATSRARRIGGRPVVPAPDDAPRPPVPAPSAGRGAAKQAPAKQAPAKAAPAKAAKPARQPRTPKAAAGNSAALRWLPASVLTGLAVVLIVLIAIAAHGVYYAKKAAPSATSSDPAQQQALAAAKTCIATINTYDYRKLDQAEASALACTTGAFTAKLSTTFEKTIKPEAPNAQATQTAQINQAGIEAVSADGKQVQILMYGQLTITNVQTTTGNPRYDPFGIVVTMDKVGSTWLVAKYGSDTGAGTGN